MRIAGIVLGALALAISSAAFAATVSTEPGLSFEQSKKVVIGHVLDHGRVNAAKWQLLVKTSEMSDNNVTYLLARGTSIEEAANAMEHLRGATIEMGQRVLQILDENTVKENANLVVKIVGETGKLDKNKLQQLMRAVGVAPQAQQHFLDSQSLHDVYERLTTTHANDVRLMAMHLNQQTICQ